MASPLTTKVFVVQRLNWRYNDNWHELVDDEPVKAFLSWDDADAYRSLLEQKHRIGRNTCKFAGGLARASGLSEEEIIVRLHELGLPLPPLDPVSNDLDYDWGDEQWWAGVEQQAGQWRSEQLWAVFDRCRQFEVIETEAII